MSLKTTLALLVSLTLGACATVHPRQDPTGRAFPEILGNTLEGREMRLPRDLGGGPALLLVGYQQRSQFDIDRWLLGLADSGVQIPRYELPTIPGLVPGLWSDRIDQGMRSGIPSEEWGAVITVYEDADVLVKFLGNENPLPARVVLLDGTGKVAFFHDQGYSVSVLLQLRDSIANLKESP